MTRLIFLAACFSGVFGTIYGGSAMGGGMMASDTMTGGQMAGDKMAGGNEMKSGGDKTKINVDVDVTIDVIQWSMGGGSAMQNVAAPAMAAGMTHQVTVGGTAGKVFTPNSIMAAVGDMVQFNFRSMNHTLTQSTFPLPCVKMAGGKDSGFMPNPTDSSSAPPMFMVQVMDTKPAWFYCKQKGHCGSGMTFSINPTANKSQDQFMQMAMQQNGTATMAMATTASSMAASSAAVAPPAVASAASSIPVVAAPVASSAASSIAAVAAPAATSTSSTMDSGMSSMMATGGSGACSCSCLCGTAAFPAGAGIGMYGGMPGAVPMASG